MEVGEVGYSVQQTTDCGYIIVGSYLGDSTVWDVYLTKVDSQGNKEWDRTFDDISYKVGSFVKQTTDGGYIIIGTAFSNEKDGIVFIYLNGSLNSYIHLPIYIDEIHTLLVALTSNNFLSKSFRLQKPHECGVSYQYINLYGYFLTVTFLLVTIPLVNPDTIISMKST